MIYVDIELIFFLLQSSNFLYVNDKEVNKNEVSDLNVGDIFKIGIPNKYFEFRFSMKEIDSSQR